MMIVPEHKYHVFCVIAVLMMIAPVLGRELIINRFADAHKQTIAIPLLRYEDFKQ